MRAFVAVEVPADDLPDLLRVCAALREVRGLRAVDPGLLHVTVQFLGEVDDAQADAAASSLVPVAFGSAAFEVRLAGLGAFPSSSRPQVVWAGCDSPELEALAARARDALSAAGFRPDKRFEPHVTLGRVKQRPDLAALKKALDSDHDAALGTFHVGEIRLKRSELTPSGPVYTDVKALRLGLAPGG